MPKIPTLTELLEAGAHFGHRDSRWHPKMAEFIFGSRSGVHIIDLEKTQEQLEVALNKLKDTAARGGMILFVGTKAQAKPFVRAAAESCGMPFVIERWLGGTLTNFNQIRNTVKRFLKLRDQKDKGELGKYTKLEQLLISREIEEYTEKVGGIETLTKLPDIVLIADARNDKTALMEARSCKLATMAVCDTNVNPTRVDFVIPMNDDAIRSIELFMTLAAAAINEGKANPVVTEKQKNKETEKPKGKETEKPAAKKVDKKEDK